MFNKLKQIKDIRDQAKAMEEALGEIIIVGQGAGGKVMITIDGNQTVQGVKIEDDIDRDKIAGAVKDAFNDASKKLKKELAAKMKDMGGLDALKDMLS